MKFVVQLLATLAFGAAVIYWIRLTTDNRQLSDEIQQLEAELGRMPIDDPTRVHLVEIDQPEVPPEVASHIDRLWQFRCYLPPSYDYIKFFGNGEVARDGLYLNGGSSSGWDRPIPIRFIDC